MIERDDRVLIEARVRPEAIPVLDQVIARQPYPLLFVTISGAHLYGFASADSDFDLRGVHVLPARKVLGLDAGRETVQVDAIEGGLEIDLVSHDAAKFFGLMLKRNGYVLEQLYSPLVVRTSPEHEELKRLGRGCITRHYVHHYLGFFATQRKLFEKDQRLKPMLYTYRVLLTGIHLLRTGELEANLEVLNGEFALPYIAELLAAKREGREQDVWRGGDLAFHLAEFDRLDGELKLAGEESGLADGPTVRAELSEMLVGLRNRRNGVRPLPLALFAVARCPPLFPKRGNSPFRHSNHVGYLNIGQK
ncbi:MAG: nucleotidyltransferase domain-containing protein [Planctomycetes bacterium]|nr:nucleotidyltransferase domain-containing protein [Planctomycetota bacterium]